MPNPQPAASIADFAAFVAHYRTDLALRKLHFARLVLGLGGTTLAVAFNYFYTSEQRNVDAVVTQTAFVVCALYMLGCFITVFLARRRFLNDFRQPSHTLKDRAWQVAQFVQRRGNILLILAATGHVLILIATEFRLHLFATDGNILLVTLIPTLLLIIHGVSEIPTRARLLQLYERVG